MPRSALAALVLSCAVAAPALAAAPTVEFFPPAKPLGPFSSAVRIGNVVYASGAIGTGADGSLPADFPTQATNAMRNLSDELGRGGATLDDVFRCSVLLADIGRWQAFNAVYQTFFKPGRYPVRIASAASGLAKGAAVEVECQAYVGR